MSTDLKRHPYRCTKKLEQFKIRGILIPKGSIIHIGDSIKAKRMGARDQPNQKQWDEQRQI